MFRLRALVKQLVERLTGPTHLVLSKEDREVLAEVERVVLSAFPSEAKIREMEAEAEKRWT